jgi:hypothetical protein
MTRNLRNASAPGALELLELAVHELRQAPPAAWASYGAGTLPFVLAFLYFWTDMSRSSDAWARCAGGAFVLACAFVWMKLWQAVFCWRLRAQLAGRTVPRLTGRQWLGATLAQAAWQPARLILLPLALLMALPFGWVLAFFENLTVLGVEPESDVRGLGRRAARLAGLWPGQNHLALGILSLLAPLVALNLVAAFVLVPAWLRMLFGLESEFTRSWWAYLNTTFVAACGAGTFLGLDPLLKAFYVLRCFRGESLRSGEDLRVELRRAAPAGLSGSIPLLLFALLGASPLNAAQVGAAGADRSALVQPAELDRAIDQVLQRREFEWRLPREAPPANVRPEGFLAGLVDDVANTLRRWGETLGRWARAVFEALRDLAEKLGRRLFGSGRIEADAPSTEGWAGPLRGLAWLFLAAVACGLAIFAGRIWRRRRRPSMVASAEVTAVPDLTDESVAADELPEDEWLRLAREQVAQGALRLALRALYLASLAHVARREWVTLAKYKSNRDYERELQRRARERPDVLSAFGENVTVFDRSWYGLHEVSTETLARLEANLERIRAC